MRKLFIGLIAIICLLAMYVPGLALPYYEYPGRYVQERNDDLRPDVVYEQLYVWKPNCLTCLARVDTIVLSM